MADELYGTAGEVVEAHKATLTLKLTHSVPGLQLHDIARKHPDAVYMTQYQACQRLGLSNNVVSRITSSLQARKMQHGLSVPSPPCPPKVSLLQVDLHKGGQGVQRLDIGLNIKFQKKGLQKAGYARRIGEGDWELSEEAVRLIALYRDTWPQVFKAIESAGRSGDRLKVEQVFPGDAQARGKANQVRAFLRALPCETAAVVKCGTTLLNKEGIAAVIAVCPLFGRLVCMAPWYECWLFVQAVHEYRTGSAKQYKHPTLSDVKAAAVYIPIDTPLPADPAADFMLGDRVVCCVHTGAVPFGLEGTVIAQYGPDADVVDCVFDKTFIGGSTLGGMVPEGMGSRVKKAHLVNRSYGQRRHAGYYARNAANTHVQAFKQPHHIGYAGPRPARGRGAAGVMPTPRPRPPVHMPAARPHIPVHATGAAAPRPRPRAAHAAAHAPPPPRPVCPDICADCTSLRLALHNY